MHRTGSLPILILAAAALARGPVAAAAAEPPVWELRPYRIQVLVGVASRPELAARWPAALAARLTERILALQGAAWDATVAPAPPALQQAMAASLAGVTADALPKDSLDADKVMLVQVSAVAAGGGYQVAAREFDTATGLWSAVVVRPVRQLSKLPDLALAAIFQAFAPLARVSAVDGHRVVLRLRASALKPHDPELAPVRPGAVFRLAARKVAGQDAAKPAVAIPWTFCTVEEVAEEELRGRLETGLRDPLPERWETAIEVLALGVVPPRQATVLTLNSTSQPPQPLAGYDIYASPAAAEEPVLLGRTDRRGSLRVAPAGDQLLQILLVKHGEQRLARLPMVAGLEPQLTLSVSDDDGLIELEGLFAGLRDAAVDLAVRREVLLSRLKARIAAGRLDEAKPLLKELRGLPGAQDLLTLRASELKKNLAGTAASQAKIDAGLREFQKVLDSQLDAKAMDKLAVQLEKPPPKPKKP